MKRYRFEAAIQPSRGWGAFVIFPHSTLQEFGIKGRVPVQALFGGIPYTGSLMPSGSGFHFLGVRKSIRDQLGKEPGDLVRVELWKDELPRSVDLPEIFVSLLKKEKLFAAFETLSFTRRKEYRNYITTPKREETRGRRMARALELLRAETATRQAAPHPRKH